jgi:hypothetical protein
VDLRLDLLLFINLLQLLSDFSVDCVCQIGVRVQVETETGTGIWIETKTGIVVVVRVWYIAEIVAVIIFDVAGIMKIV